ncbi:MAG: hypothetical protein AB8I08_16055 [Sandaracinaceae bacterium]
MDITGSVFEGFAGIVGSSAALPGGAPKPGPTPPNGPNSEPPGGPNPEPRNPDDPGDGPKPSPSIGAAPGAGRDSERRNVTTFSGSVKSVTKNEMMPHQPKKKLMADILKNASWIQGLQRLPLNVRVKWRITSPMF